MLSPRGREVARLVALGLTNRQIAAQLSLSERTVEWHVDQILNRLGFSTRSQVAAWVARTEMGIALRRPGVARARTNLPAPLTRFVGRQRDLEGVRRLVSGQRLVTITGPGGIGKTRLATELGRELEPSAADGVWLCELAPVRDLEAATDAVAQTLGAETTLAEHLAERDLVLVLDTCEHLLPQLGTLVEKLLTGSPGLRVMATSRSPLGITGEAVWRLGPMVEADAVRVFTERAVDALPEFDVVAAAAEIERLCEKLGRVPLALELAASRLRVRSLGEIAGVVLDPRSMAPVAEWSYRLLSHDAQGAFRAMSVFARWFEVEDADAVMPNVRELLSELVESSMLIYDERGNRYRMLEVLRPYAQELLARAGEASEMELAHAERIIALAELLDVRRDDALTDVWRKVAEMIDDVRGTLGKLLAERPRRGAWLASALVTMWGDTGRLDEGLRWTDAALRVETDPTLERCSLLYAKAMLLHWLGRPEPGGAAFFEAKRLTPVVEAGEFRAELLVRAAMVHSFREEWDHSEAAQREAVAEFTASGREQSAARALNHLALSLLFQGRFVEGREAAAQSLALRRRRGVRIEPALDTFAQACALLGDLDEAQRSWLEAGRLAAAAGDPLGTSCAMRGLSFVCASNGRREDALRLHYFAEQLAGAIVADDQPLGPALRKSVSRLEKGLAKELLARLRAEASALTPGGALRLAAAAK